MLKRGQKCDESKNVYDKSLKFLPAVREKKEKITILEKKEFLEKKEKKIQLSVKRIHELVGVMGNSNFSLLLFPDVLLRSYK